MPRIAIINVVGLCQRILGPETPFLSRFARDKNRSISKIRPLLPAVTSTMQATFLTGKPPGEHGIVANYWYDREFAEHRGWKQSNYLVSGKKIWERIREENPGYTCAKVFWWNNMYSSADYSITPRPIYCADGKKVFDVQTWPMNLRDDIKQDLGNFPFPAFWGPAAGLPSSEWIAKAAMWFEEKFSPGMNLVYLPHLDYNLQRFGPSDTRVEEDFRQIDQVVEELVTYLESRGVTPVILSEYGITPVHRPVHINRAFREKGWISCRDELGREQIDPGNCKALAISDHQLAHIYINDQSIEEEVKNTVSALEGVASVHLRPELAGIGIDHERAGDLVAVTDEHSWFTYYYWNDDEKAPDFARCVDIHRKPGYDPAELFIDPAICCPKLKIAGKLLKKKLGFRMLMDLIPLDADLVKGSHGCIPESEDDFPLLIGNFAELRGDETIDATQVYDHLLALALALALGSSTS
ncbi:MAG: alkaline phosphatase family protein [Verrucomicrobiales bacterium]|nr:alkaline phosphatase family protein [Verrucomicrobiales bacterium]